MFKSCARVFLHKGKNLGKGVNLTILPPEQTVLFDLNMATGLGEGKLNSNLLKSASKLILFRILLVRRGR